MSAKLEKMKTERASLIEAAQELQKAADDEARFLVEDEQKRFDDYMVQADKLVKPIETRERLENAQADIEQSTRKIKPEAGKIDQPGHSRVEVMPVGDASKLRAFRGPDALQKAYRAGKWIAGFIYDNQPAREWCREHGVGSGVEQRVHQEGIASKGGVLVPDELEAAIITLRDEYGVMRREARIWTMTSDTKSIPRRTGGLTAHFVGEDPATGVTESDTAWDNVTLVAKDCMVGTRISRSLEEDSIVNIAEIIADEMALAYSTKEDLCGVDGTGILTHGGMTGFRTKMVDGLHAGTYITAGANIDLFSEVMASDLNEMMALCPQYALGGAKWYMSPFAWGTTVIRLSSAMTGNTMPILADGMRNMQYMGYPIVLMNQMPGNAIVNLAIGIAFGNMRQAISFGDRKGMTMLSDPYTYASKGQIALYGFERFDIVVHDIGSATAAGPLVGLYMTT